MLFQVISLACAISLCAGIISTQETARNEDSDTASKCNHQPVTTQLTPRFSAVASRSPPFPADVNSHVFVDIFADENRSLPLWTAWLSTGNAKLTLSHDTNAFFNDTSYLAQGLFVTYNQQSTEYGTVILLSGKIVDGGTIYSLTGMVLGVFYCEPNEQIPQPPMLATIMTPPPPQKDCDHAPVRTQLSPNIYAVASRSEPFPEDVNHHVSISIYASIISDELLWKGLLSFADVKLMLSEDIASQIVAATYLRSGLSVSLSAQSSVAGDLILLSGQLVDEATVYDITGMVLGVFYCQHSPDGASAPLPISSPRLRGGHENAVTVKEARVFSQGCSRLPVHTLLTPYFTAVVSRSPPFPVDYNSHVSVSINYGTTPLWTGLLSTANTHLELSEDFEPMDDEDDGTWLATGLAVTMSAEGSYGDLILLSGGIVDRYTNYSFTGMVLGVFYCDPSPNSV